jgi:hypothetical protein
MRSNLAQRLKRLEARVKPADETPELVIQFIGPAKEVVRTLIIGGTNENGRYGPRATAGSFQSS